MSNIVPEVLAGPIGIVTKVVSKVSDVIIPGTPTPTQTSTSTIPAQTSAAPPPANTETAFPAPPPPAPVPSAPQQFPQVPIPSEPVPLPTSQSTPVPQPSTSFPSFPPSSVPIPSSTIPPPRNSPISPPPQRPSTSNTEMNSSIFTPSNAGPMFGSLSVPAFAGIVGVVGFVVLCVAGLVMWRRSSSRKIINGDLETALRKERFKSGSSSVLGLGHRRGSLPGMGLPENETRDLPKESIRAGVNIVPTTSSPAYQYTEEDKNHRIGRLLTQKLKRSLSQPKTQAQQQQQQFYIYRALTKLNLSKPSASSDVQVSSSSSVSSAHAGDRKSSSSMVKAVLGAGDRVASEMEPMPTATVTTLSSPVDTVGVDVPSLHVDHIEEDKEVKMEEVEPKLLPGQTLASSLGLLSPVMEEDEEKEENSGLTAKVVKQQQRIQQQNMNPRAFLEFAFAHDADYQALVDSYNRTINLIRTRGSEIGINPSVEPIDLDEVSRELLESFYNSVPTLAALGPCIMDPPPPPKPKRVVVEVFMDQTPKAAENFLRLCDGTKGLSKSAKKPLHYLNNKVHRIVPNFIVQLGDITRQDGSGGDSIFNGKFNDEPAGLKLKPDKFSVCMANSGKHSNTSQFFFVITEQADKLKGLAGKHVVFGKVVEGFEVLELRLNAVGRKTGGDTPTEDVWVSNCGVL
ncbi:hypothetical protein HDV05_007014 [Chytridiales sp. JEL 0842]|nr:hypothetical protein HDV05_007014 [Chytridiales sp. JEL 0842]